MQNWIDSDFFGTWKDAQSRIIKILKPNAQLKQSSEQGSGEQKQGPNFISDCGESAVKESLQLQAQWINQWMLRSEEQPLSLQVFTDLVQQMNQAMENWTNTQDELWKLWFELLDCTTAHCGQNNPIHDHIQTWKTIVEESHAELNLWFTKWEEQINCKPLVPDDLSRLTVKLGEEMLGWMQNQAVLWQFGFDSLNSTQGYCQFPNPLMPSRVEWPATARKAIDSFSKSGPSIQPSENHHTNPTLPESFGVREKQSN